MSRKHENLRSTDQFDNTDRFSVENYHCAIQAAMFFHLKMVASRKSQLFLCIVITFYWDKKIFICIQYLDGMFSYIHKRLCAYNHVHIHVQLHSSCMYLKIHTYYLGALSCRLLVLHYVQLSPSSRVCGVRVVPSHVCVCPLSQ